MLASNSWNHEHFSGKLLPRGVRIYGEGHQLADRHCLPGIGLEQHQRTGGELQPLPDHAVRDEEGRGDLLLAAALVVHCLEGAERVAWMHGRALDVLGETVLLGHDIGAHDAGHGRVPG